VLISIPHGIAPAATFETTEPAGSTAEKYMQHAIELARRSPPLPFGAVIVNTQGDILGEGWNRIRENPLFHGEIVAINDCAKRHPNLNWSDLALYTTAEPCAMCQSAVAWTGISRVFYGSSIPFLKTLKWPAIELRATEIAARVPFRRCQIKGGILREQCDALFQAAVGGTHRGTRPAGQPYTRQ